ncbi:hypothetical protein VBR27_18660, partial [Klebsiella pneumoniae]|nr:hypothetical protein [Klebsiella pneumoniae]
MANWLHQLQSLLGQQGASPSGESSKGSGLLPGAIGGLAGLLVASKSSRKLLAKYGTSALLSQAPGRMYSARAFSADTCSITPC